MKSWYEKLKLESDFDIMIKKLNKPNVYYRITYNEERIYNALKK